MDYSSYYGTSASSSGNSVGSLIAALLIFIGMWKVFEKAGERGWKVLIPFYGSYILFKIAGRNYWKFLILSIVFCFCLTTSLGGAFVTMALGISGSNSGVAFGGTITLITGIIALVSSIWLLVEDCRLCDAVSKCFGHGLGFAAGLFFLAPIFYMILGFNSDQYQGVGGSQTTSPIQ